MHLKQAVGYGTVFDLEGEKDCRFAIYDPAEVLSISRADENAWAIDCFMRENPGARIGVFRMLAEEGPNASDR